METDDLSRLLLTTLLTITPDAVISIDEEQRITLFTEGAERTFGYRRDEVLGQPLDRLLPARFRAVHADHIRKFGMGHESMRRMSERVEIRALHKDGHEFPAEAAICKLTLGHRRTFSVLLRDVTERKRREAHSQLLMRELEHRVRNVLTRVEIVIERSADTRVSMQEFRKALLDRIKSMMRAHALLHRTHWRGVTLGDLIEDQLKPYVASHSQHLEGPEIVLNPDAVQTLTMVIHELTTNAVKHGALSSPDGRITVSWRRKPAQEADEEQLALQWSERGGPTVKRPQREGYGTTLIRELLTYEFDGSVAQHYSPEGLVCQISLPLAPLTK
jgi:PAS domain S-box-containing protein